jgi:CheY-like chemotaxis protein
MNFELILVDDDPDCIFFHKLLVKKSGLCENPTTFKDGQELIDYFSANIKTGIGDTLIFPDLYMVRIGGWEVLDYLEKAKFQDKIKVIVISSSVSMNDKMKALGYSTVMDYIEKPLLKSYLISLKNQSLF